MKLRHTKIVAFSTLDISQGIVATHLRCGGPYYTFSLDSESEIISKIS